MRILLITFVALLLSCRTTTAVAPIESTATPSQPKPTETLTRITLVGTNDVHGWIVPREHTLSDGTKVLEGGADVFAGYLDILRRQNPGGVLLLDGGDMFQGTLPANLTEGKVVVQVYNRLGYTASAIGNHEFDYGPVGPVSVGLDPNSDSLGALKERFREAKFPFLAVNIYDAQTGERPDWLGNEGTLLLEVKGLKVGIIGLSTPSTPQTTHPVNVASLRFGSLVPATLTAAQRLRERGADLVIAIAHAGGECGDLANPRDISSCEENHEIFDLLNQIPPKTLDAVIAGHTHQPLGHFVNGTPVIETAGMGRTFGIVELFVDARRQVVPERTVIESSIPLCLQTRKDTQRCDEQTIATATAAELVDAQFRAQRVRRAPELAEVFAPALEMAAQEQRRSLSLQVPVRMERDFDGESSLGRFLTDSMRAMENADVALMNGGGLRADLPAGTLSYGAIYEVLPFDNTVATVTLTGEELVRVLRAAYSVRRGILQLSGIKVSLSSCPGQDRLLSYSLEDKRPLPLSKRFKVVMPDFLARGGDGFGAVMAGVPAGRVDLGTTRSLNLRDSLVSYWQKMAKPLVASTSRRISFADDKDRCPEAGRSMTSRWESNAGRSCASPGIGKRREGTVIGAAARETAAGH